MSIANWHEASTPRLGCTHLSSATARDLLQTRWQLGHLDLRNTVDAAAVLVDLIPDLQRISEQYVYLVFTGMGKPHACCRADDWHSRLVRE